MDDILKVAELCKILTLLIASEVEAALFLILNKTLPAAQLSLVNGLEKGRVESLTRESPIIPCELRQIVKIPLYYNHG